MPLDPVTICLCQFDSAVDLTDSTAVDRVATALDDLEASYRRPSERIVALEIVLHDFGRRRPSIKGSAFGRFLRTAIERRQDQWSIRSA